MAKTGITRKAEQSKPMREGAKRQVKSIRQWQEVKVDIEQARRAKLNCHGERGKLYPQERDFSQMKARMFQKPEERITQ